jgi:transketolase
MVLPIEHIAALRAIPDFMVIRPADANETVIAWREIISRRQPSGILLSRQNLPVFDRTILASAEGVARGAYALNKVDHPDVILIATGSEVAIALSAAELLAAQSIKARVVSAPCLEWFDGQDENYKESLLPKNCRARVSIEAGVSQGWREYVGDAGEIISLDHFGASASHTVLFKEFGFTPENVVDAAKRSIARSKA